MNRCSPTFASLASRRCASASLAALLLGGATISAFSAFAQTTPRSFPPKAERGVMQITQPPEMLLNGKADRLSPGARIHGADNALRMSGTLIGQKVAVNYVREPTGQVHEVWVLTEAEAAQKMPAKP